MMAKPNKPAELMATHQVDQVLLADISALEQLVCGTCLKQQRLKDHLI